MIDTDIAMIRYVCHSCSLLALFPLHGWASQSFISVDRMLLIVMMCMALGCGTLNQSIKVF